MFKQTKREKIAVWDPFIRLFHWSLLFAVVFAFISAEKGMQEVHKILGYFISLAVVMRVIWGFWGSDHARFSSFVVSLKDAVAYLRSIIQGKPRRYLGHNPAGGLMVIFIIGTLLLLSLTGLIVLSQKEFEGPFVHLTHGLSEQFVYMADTIHHWLGEFVLILLVIPHILGVVAASLQHRENLVLAMITGYKKRFEIETEVETR